MENKEIEENKIVADYGQMNQEEVKKAVDKIYDEKSEEFDKISNEKLIISLIGSVNAGKSKTINALTGIKYAEVKAIAGYTKEISLYKLKKDVFIADTPGLHDINEDVSKKASDYVDNKADIVLYFINAAVGLTKQEKEAYLSVKELGKEMIVVLNKIDTLDEEGITDTLEQIEQELNVKPVAISAQKNIGIGQLHSKIASVLEKKGKHLLFIKTSKQKFKDEEVNNWINGATITATSIGAVPIPGADIIPLTALQVGLAMKIAHIYGINPSKDDIMKLIGASITGQVGKQLAKWGIQMLKATGWIPGAQILMIATSTIGGTIAGSLTYGFGHACHKYYKNNMSIDMGEFGAIFEKISTEYKKDKA